MLPLPKTLRQHLDARITAGELVHDPAQDAAVTGLDAFLQQIATQKPAGFLHKLIGKKAKDTSTSNGVYLFGPVGRGKTMLMDGFLACLPDNIRVMRTHFHRFMLGVHDFSHARQQAGQVSRMDQVLLAYADQLAASYDLIAFDEFHVVDVADAMLLGRLVKALLDRGIYLLMTSNWPPEDLYKGGLQRDRFLPVIALIRQHMQVLEAAGTHDFRRNRVQASDLYLTPLNAKTQAHADDIFSALTDNESPASKNISVKGRQLNIAKTAKGVAQVDFQTLCGKALGAQDYLALAAQFHTLILCNVPQLTPDQRNEAKRLMILVDVFYEQQRLLVITADVLPDVLYNGDDHGFEFQRTASRLMEMQSQAYLAQLG